MLKVDSEDSQLATEVASLKPQASTVHAAGLQTLEELLTGRAVQSPKKLFELLLKALADLRPRLPQIFSIAAKRIFVREETN